MDKMTVGEFQAKFGENRAIASLAVIVEDEEKDKKRIIHDATHGVRVNHRIHCRDKIRAPGAEKKQILPRSLSLLKVPTTPVACLIHRSYGATPPATFMHNLPPQVLVPIKRNFSSSFKQQEPFPNVFADTGQKPSCHKCICEALSACLSKLLGRDTFASHLALVTDLLCIHSVVHFLSRCSKHHHSFCIAVKTKILRASLCQGVPYLNMLACTRILPGIYTTLVMSYNFLLLQISTCRICKFKLPERWLDQRSC